MLLSHLLLVLLPAYLHAIKLTVAVQPSLGGWLAALMAGAGMPVLIVTCQQHLSVKHTHI